MNLFAELCLNQDTITRDEASTIPHNSMYPVLFLPLMQYRRESPDHPERDNQSRDNNGEQSRLSPIHYAWHKHSHAQKLPQDAHGIHHDAGQCTEPVRQPDDVTGGAFARYEIFR